MFCNAYEPTCESDFDGAAECPAGYLPRPDPQLIALSPSGSASLSLPEKQSRCCFEKQCACRYQKYGVAAGWLTPTSVSEPEKAAVGEQCPVQGSNHCATCDAGYHLEPNVTAAPDAETRICVVNRCTLSGGKTSEPRHVMQIHKPEHQLFLNIIKFTSPMRSMHQHFPMLSGSLLSHCH